MTLPIRPPAACGTESGYNRHREHGEPICERCRLAKNAAKVDQAARKALTRGHVIGLGMDVSTAVDEIAYVLGTVP